MKIINNTNVDLNIQGSKLPSGSKKDFYEACFNTLSIHSDIGSAEITTEYSKRYIKNFGKITVEETGELDENGLPNIVVY